MSNNPLITKFEKLVKDLNTIIFGDDDQDVILDDIVKPTISKWLRSIVTDINDAIDIAAAAGAGANGWTAQLIVDASGVTQQEINDKSALRVQDISELRNYTPRKNDQIVEVIDYDTNVKGVFNKYIYRQDETIADNYGTVIASDVVAGRWLMLPKDEYYPRDFGVIPSFTSLDNDAKLQSYLNSQLPLQIGVGTYSFSVHKNIGEVPLNIKGRGYDKSIIERVSIFIKTSNNYLADFRINTLSNNYSVLIKQGSYNKIERVHAYDNYDSFSVWQQFTDQTESKNNRFIDCIGEKSRRIGFTTDLRANRTFFENCTAIDCRQGFHMEGSKDSFITKAKTIRCGLSSPTGVGEQDSYAGPLRTYGVDGLYVDGFENIDPAGTFYWQHGGAADSSKNLVFKNMRGMGSLILDPAAEITENMYFENVENLGMFIEGFLQATVGRIVVKDCHQTSSGVQDFMVTGNPLTDIYISNSALGTLSLNCRDLFLNNLQAFTGTRHGIKAVNIESTGLLSSVQTTYQDIAGFLFDMATASRFKFEVLRLGGVSGGAQLSFSNLSTVPKLLNFGDLQWDVASGITINGVAASEADLASASIQIGSPKVYRSDVLPTNGVFAVGDKILKNTVGVDTIYGWVCTTGGVGAAVVWKPLKHDV